MIYSYTHSDHFGGVKGLMTDAEVAAGRCRVVASEGFTQWVLNKQSMTAEGMTSRNDINIDLQKCGRKIANGRNTFDGADQ